MSDDNLRDHSFSSTLRVYLLVIEAYARLVSTGTSRDFPLSIFLLAMGTLGLQTHVTMTDFM